MEAIGTYTSKGNLVLVSPEDQDILEAHMWQENCGYAVTANCVLRLASMILERYWPRPRPDLTIDHLNRDRLDNRRVNLDWVTRTEQNLNRQQSGIPEVGPLDGGEFKVTIKLYNFEGNKSRLLEEGIFPTWFEAFHWGELRREYHGFDAPNDEHLPPRPFILAILPRRAPKKDVATRANPIIYKLGKFYADPAQTPWIKGITWRKGLTRPWQVSAARDAKAAYFATIEEAIAHKIAIFTA